MKFYIASGLENKENVQYVRDRLLEAGHIHTYDWTKNNRATTEEELRAIGTAERDAVLESDVVIVLLPGGKGTHTELGMAIGLEKKIYIYASEKLDPKAATTFYYLDGIKHFYGELEQFIREILIENEER
ncbi:nucleoside 2-deoxyribosyltransferase [Ornithinibacillus scapharcae]|uniref:nucleoside 2-deoxyribosyltransferase n=1 Tax=Ornithinibacillus scapharcae TaxID=1147159 RepID=UPI000225BAA3|nr:nucleoside 2-deoxyribosyltransferase [Ornithinibacillus scapharcae]